MANGDKGKPRVALYGRDGERLPGDRLLLGRLRLLHRSHLRFALAMLKWRYHFLSGEWH